MSEPLDRNETDTGPRSPLHTLGLSANQAMPGNIVSEQTITGSRASGAALVSVIAALTRLGIVDATTP